MKNYIQVINFLQNALVGGSVFFLMTSPLMQNFYPELLPAQYVSTLFFISLLSVTFVMAIRPLSDLLPRLRWLRSLIILRKGFGVVSASIIVSFILSKMIHIGVFEYLAPWGTLTYWSLDGFALLAHLSDITAIILLITSNNFSKRILGKNWKRVQKLAYVYFYCGALYVVLAFGNMFAVTSLIFVTLLVFLASLKKHYT